ncbi:fatty acyl-AMP ligase [Kitasatospora sp. NPDC047058]|uniref:fatty acyl-AMP ligase n=1 Tax=Kitasatospora sp. NPDC047058 TaxID=3155620 RepID=UPI0033D2BC2A
MSLSRFVTFTELVRARTAELADAPAHIFLRDTPGGLVAETLSYAELDREARRIAAVLQAHRAEGRPVLLLYPSTTEFLKAFVGCLYAGAVAVPVPLPGAEGDSKRLNRTAAVLRDVGTRLVLTDTASAPEVALCLADSYSADVVCLATDTPGLGDPENWLEPAPADPEDLVFLQYTSGSVSDPRGVMVSHRNLLANQQALQDAFGTTAEDRFGGWLPHYHDMGLIAHLLHPIWLGSCSVQMTPTAFVKRPHRWLRAIQDHGVTVGGGPNFCYDLCVRRVTDQQLAELDLSRWRLALNGAEPVRQTTLKAFAERFAAAGFSPEALYPCYGLAEATLIVSGGVPGTAYAATAVDATELERDRFTPADPDRIEQPFRTLVGSGRVQGFDLRIVDPVAHRELPPGAVGEIWLRGDSVARGYWQRHTETAETFRATLSDGETGFLRTGDLGVLEDGELYVTGRLKEVVILNGRNVYPQDVEWAVRGLHPGFGLGAAFAAQAGREQLVVVQEVKGLGPDTDAAGLRGLAQRIQALLGRDFNIPAGNVLLVPPGTVRRTTSGKVQRTLMRRLFLDGELRGDYEVLDPVMRALVRGCDDLPGAELLGDDLLGAGLTGDGPGTGLRGPEPAGGGLRR